MKVMMKRTFFKGTRAASHSKVGIKLAVLALGLGSAVACSSERRDDAKANKNTPGSSLAEIAASTPDLSTLFSLVKLCDLGSALANPETSLTVFAPTNGAFAKLLGDAPAPTECSAELKTTLLYHVLPVSVRSSDLSAQQEVTSLAGKTEKVFVTADENGVTVNGNAKVVIADVAATNGVAHVIDTVLIPDAQGTVVDAAAKRYDFTSLVGAVVAADLAGTLSTAENITVFAPTNAAFAELSAVPPKDALVKVLTHHVLGSTVLAENLVPGLQSPNTLNGDALNIFVGSEGVNIWGSAQSKETSGNIIATDIITRNGVIHAISKVLIPSNL